MINGINNSTTRTNKSDPWDVTTTEQRKEATLNLDTYDVELELEDTTSYDPRNSGE